MSLKCYITLKYFLQTSRYSTQEIKQDKHKMHITGTSVATLEN